MAKDTRCREVPLYRGSLPYILLLRRMSLKSRFHCEKNDYTNRKVNNILNAIRCYFYSAKHIGSILST